MIYMDYSVFDDIMDCLQNHGRTIDEIEWAGSADFSIPLDLFFDLCKKIPYDDEGGHIPTDVLVVGKDFWLEMVVVEHETATVWTYRTFPQKPNRECAISSFDVDFSHEEQSAIDAELDRRYLNGVVATPNCSYYMLWMLLYKEQNHCIIGDE